MKRFSYLFPLLAMLITACIAPPKPISSPTAESTQPPSATFTAQPTATPTPIPTRSPITSTPPEPTLTLIPVQQDTITVYLNQLSRFLSSFNGLPSTNLLGSRLSPNGQWVLPDKHSFQLEADTFDITSVGNPENIIHLPIASSLLQLPPDYDNELRSCGEYAPTPWSPDSTAVLLSGGYKNLLVCTVLLIYDMSDPTSTRAAVFKPDEGKIPEYNGYPGNAVILRTEWSADGTKILVTFSSTAQTKTEYGWIIDRTGQVLVELFIGDHVSIFWMEDQLVEVKNQKEIWIMDPWQGTQEKIYSSANEIEIIEYKSGYHRILLVEKGTTIDYLVFDVNTRQIEARIASKMSEGVSIVDFDHAGIPTPSNYTVIVFAGFQIFDWDTYILYDYGDEVSPIGWSPIANGFIVMGDHDGLLRIISP